MKAEHPRASVLFAFTGMCRWKSCARSLPSSKFGWGVYAVTVAPLPAADPTEVRASQTARRGFIYSRWGRTASPQPSESLNQETARTGPHPAIPRPRKSELGGRKGDVLLRAHEEPARRGLIDVRPPWRERNMLYVCGSSSFGG